MSARRSGAPAYAVEIANSYEEVAARWEAMRRAGAALAFQSETWLSAWYAHVAPGERATPLLATIVDRQSGRDVAALPLARRVINGVGHIEFADSGLTDYNAPILGAPDDAIDGRALSYALRVALPAADTLRLRKMPELIGASRNPLASASGARASRLHGNILEAPDAWDDWHFGLERTFRKEIERSLRVFERRGGIFRRVLDGDDAKRVFAELKRLQRARIAELGHPYILDTPHIDAFYDQVLETGLKRGDVVLTSLEAGGEVVAALLGLVKDNRFVMVRLGVAGGDWKNCSPGRLMIERTMKHLHGEGRRIFDFTIGDYAYKRRLGAVETQLVDADAALSWRGAPMVAGERLRSAARRSPTVMAAARWIRARAS